MIRPWLAYLLTALAFVGKVTFAQTIYLPHYTTKNGLPSNNCYYALQDHKDFIWIATESGVSRFNGDNFENFSVDDGLPDNQIVQLHEDRKGRIWFLSLNGQLSYFYNGKIYNANTDKSLAQLNLNAIIVSFYEDNEGIFWFGTNKNYVAHWDGKTLIKLSPKPGQTSFYNLYITGDAQGRIYALNQSGFFVWNGKQFISQPLSNLPLSYKSISKIGNSLSFLSDKGWATFRNGKLSSSQLLSKSFTGSNIGYIYADTNEFWIPTENGVFAYDKNEPPLQYLNGRSVNQVFKDRAANMWFTTSNGVFKLPQRNNRVYVINQNSGLSTAVAKSLSKPVKGHLWIGLQNGNLALLNLASNGIKNIMLPMQFGDVMQVCNDEHGLLYFASENKLGRLPMNGNVEAAEFLKEADNAQFVIKNFSLNKSNELALALSSGMVSLANRKNLVFTSKTNQKGQTLIANRSYRVFFDAENQLWFSNSDGLQILKNGKANRVDRNALLLSRRITDIKQLNAKVLVLATDGYGILLLKNGKLAKQITLKNGLNSNIINKLYVFQNSVWAIGNNGVNKIDFAKGDIENPKIFDYNNDLLASEVNDLSIGKDTAYFATNQGLVYFSYANRATSAQMHAYITELMINGKLQDLSNPSYTLPPGDHHVIVSFNAINFTGRKVSYRYRLKTNSDWQETKLRKLDISSLDPGRYQIEIQAKSLDGQWGTSSTIYLQLDSFFWQTNLFLSAMCLLGAYFIFKGAVFITRRQKDREQDQLLLKNKILVLEQRALQAMMNPHFVFNVMNSIQHHININNTTSANKILTGFAKLIRKNLDIVTKSYISLEEEMAYLKLYLNLEKYRFGDKLQFDLAIDPTLDVEEIFIPSMLLQPFVENAIWHGIMPKEQGGHIHISLSKNNDDYLAITITDDGIGIENTKKQRNTAHESKGMALTADRIALLNKIEDRPIYFNVHQNGTYGTTVEIRLPI